MVSKKTDMEEWKVGDKCWFFNGQNINEFILTGIDKQEGCFTRIEGHYHGQPNQKVIMTMPYPIFHTREELCAFYRKIFE